MAKYKKSDALLYHSEGRPGKIEVIPTTPTSTYTDLSLAYSPGVAEPCLEIAKNKDDVYKYTAKGNLVAVISNGTAVLGLGDIGPEASKPVMEGKGVLFKIFADIDVFDIEVDASDVETFVTTVKAIAPTFGGINLEDISAPEAFEIEERLKAELDIPVMHDDQHGTAIISSAALINALELTNKKIEDIRLVVSGAGAAAQSCINLIKKLGLDKRNLAVFDSKGLISTKRTDLSERKKKLASDKDYKNLDEAMEGADVFLGLSVADMVSKSMIRSMAKDPIVFALANPNPEISYADAVSVRKDIIMATGRSDHPNQVNNVLGFPYIFRGALDVRATAINDEMKLAAVHAISTLAKEPVPEEVNQAYDSKNITYGRDMIIPKPLDYRLLTFISTAVAKAAMDSGVAKKPILDWAAYELELNKRLGNDSGLVRRISERARRNPKRIVFAEAENYKILKAAETTSMEGSAYPILLGDKQIIENMIKENNLELTDYEIINNRDKSNKKKREEFGKLLFEKRKRKGISMFEATKLMRDRNYFGLMLIETGYADAFISGLTRNYGHAIKPVLQIIGTSDRSNMIAGMYIVQTKKGPFFFADTTMIEDPTAEELVEIALLTSRAVKQFNLKPNIAMLSYSNFGSAQGKDAKKVRKAVKIMHDNHPEVSVDGDIQANFALNNELSSRLFPFSELVNKNVNVLIFPNLSAGNIAYKLMQEMGEKETIGPILMGLKKPFHVLQMGSTVRDIVNMIRIAVVDAQLQEKRKK
ncbi:MAG: malate dehydrogenase (oxaloacetate-decarboxylating)(NADP+) [Glaciecola sp.]|jgi:malate dehydrogenase (oxaloacetate-decarboxylating)(NADP+)